MTLYGGKDEKDTLQTPTGILEKQVFPVFSKALATFNEVLTLRAQAAWGRGLPILEL